MSALEEVEAALDGVRQAAPAVPVVITLSFDTHGHTMMGVSPEQAAKELTVLGAAAVGGNCGLGPAELLPAMAAMRAAAPDTVLVAKPNAGLPVLEDGRAVYQGSPGEMADYAQRPWPRACASSAAAAGARPRTSAPWPKRSGSRDKERRDGSSPAAGTHRRISVLD